MTTQQQQQRIPPQRVTANPQPSETDTAMARARTTTEAPGSSATPPTPVVPHAPETVVRCMIELPASTFEQYAKQGIARHLDPEEVMSERLSRFAGLTAAQPLIFDDDQRRRLDETLGHNCRSPEIVLAQVATAVKIRLEDIEVSIPARVMRRLPSRVFRGETMAGVVQREVLAALRRFVGLE